MNNLDKFYTSNSIDFSNKYFQYLSEVLSKIDTSSIDSFIKMIISAREDGRSIYFIGNGGSAATASHFANDLSIGTNSYEKPFRIFSLTDNQAIITAIANDYGYDDIFVRQLNVLAKPGDVVVGISASGNSKNIINAFEFAKKSGIYSFAITAFDGGKMKQIADDGIHVPTELKEYGPAEDAHMIIDHLVGSYLIRYVKNERILK